MIARLLAWLAGLGIAQPDKVAHWTVGWVLGFMALFPAVGSEGAVLLGAAAAWGKERYDKAHPDHHSWDGWDAYATLLGTVCAVGVIRVLKHYVSLP